MIRKIIFAAALIGGSWKCANAQNLDKIGQKGAVTVTGGLNFNSIGYLQSGISNPTRDPFTWYASGNVNVSILDVSLPFTYTYSNQGGKFTQPFNRAAIHPKYKWATAHLGMVNMNFSPYTLSGHLFLGGGVEMTPGKWKIQAMGGRLQKAIQYDPIADNVNEVAYNRFGYGLKVGYEDKGYGGEITLFKANDVTSSLTSIPNNSEIKPQDNFVFSLKAMAKIVKSLTLDAEYAMSLLTQNSYDNSDLSSDTRSILYGLVNGNSTTALFNAFNSSVNYSFKIFNIGFKFEHVDPGYKTLGGYYFNNDLQNYTLTPSISLLKKRLNISANTGFQRNNLSTSEASTTNRWIGSTNISYVPNSKLVLNATYSNFSSFTRNRPASNPFYFQPADTLNFFQLTQTASGMVSYNIGTEKLKNVLQLLYNYQESSSLSGNISNASAFGINIETSESKIPARTHMINSGYTAQLPKVNTAITLALNVNRTTISDQNSTFYGPTLNVQKSLLKKTVNLSFGSTYNRQYSNNILSSNILNHRLGFTYNPKFQNEKIGKIGISFNMNVLQRFAIDTSTPNITESTIFLNLNYNI